jgi:hypothetical protein
MLRGSRPGERRGGRKRDTPNRRTVLTDRILSIGSEHPTASPCAFLLILVKDRNLPADTRMAVAPKCFATKRTRSGGTRRPRASADIRSSVAQGTGAKSMEGSKSIQTAASAPANQDWNPQVLDALLGIVQDVTADFKARRKAALKIAEFLLPKAGKKAKVVPDEYGFTVNPNLARKYRDIRRELRSLDRGPTRKIPAVAQKIQKLTAQADAIRQRLQVPCPSKYGREQVHQDLSRLIEFIELRANNTALTEAQDDEEAHLRARFDVFAYGPEHAAHLRRQALQDAERQFKKNIFLETIHTRCRSRAETREILSFCDGFTPNRAQRRPSLTMTSLGSFAITPFRPSYRLRTEIYTRKTLNCGRKMQLTICWLRQRWACTAATLRWRKTWLIADSLGMAQSNAGK